jgi:hypothetical protein
MGNIETNSMLNIQPRQLDTWFDTTYEQSN